MANQIPLIVNAGAAQIQELATADNLIVAANVVTGGIKTDGYYYANGTPVTFGGSGNVDLQHVATDIIPSGNNTQSLGNATNQWADLWVSNATIYFNSVPLSLDADNQLTIGNSTVVTTSGSSNTISATDISITGTVTSGNVVTLEVSAPVQTTGGVNGHDLVVAAGYYDYGDISAEGGTLYLQSGNALSGTAGAVVVGAGENNWTFDQAGNVSFPNGTLQTPDSLIVQSGSDVTVQQISGNVTSKAYFANTYTTLQSIDTTTGPYPAVAGLVAELSNIAAPNVSIIVNSADVDPNGNLKTWLFDASGNLTAPGAISTTGNVSGSNVNASYFYGSGQHLDLSTMVSTSNIGTPGVGGSIGNINLAGNITFTPYLGSINWSGGASHLDFTQYQRVDLVGSNFNVYGNITADTGNFFKGDGSYLTNLPAPTVTLDNTSNGYMDIMTYDGNIKYVSNATIEPLSGNIHTAGNISAQGNIAAQGVISATGDIITAGNFVGNFTGNITGNLVVNGANTQVLFNDQGNANAVGGFTYNKDSNVLSVLGLISAQGNVAGDYLLGNGYYIPNVNAVQVVNGTSNVTVPTTNGNIVVTVAGTATSTFDTAGNFRPAANIITSQGMLAEGNIYTESWLVANNMGVDAYQLNVTSNANVTGNVATQGIVSAVGNIITANTFVGNGAGLTNLPASSILANSAATFTLLSDNTLLSGTVASPQNFKVNDAYTPDIDLRNASGTGMFTQGANATIRAAGTYNWSFANNGNLTLPGNTFAVNYANGTPVSLGSTSVAEASFSIQTSNFTATAGSRYGVDTSGASVTATLPEAPPTGTAIFFADAAGAYSTNNLILDPAGATIMGSSENMTVSTNGQSVGLFWTGSDWRIYNAG